MKGNKVCLKLKEGKNAYVSNGSEGRADEEDVHITPEQMSKHLVNSMKYSGLLFGAEASPVLERIENAGGKGIFRTSALKRGDDGKVGEHDAQVVKYRLTFIPEIEEFINEKPSFSVKLWLDANTGLPLKRRLTGKVGDKTITIKEKYTKFVIDEKIDEKLFELPK